MLQHATTLAARALELNCRESKDESAVKAAASEIFLSVSRIGLDNLCLDLTNLLTHSKMPHNIMELVTDAFTAMAEASKFRFRAPLIRLSHKSLGPLSPSKGRTAANDKAATG